MNVRLIACLSFAVSTVSWLQTNDEFDPVTVIPRAFVAIKNVNHFPASDPKVDLNADELVLGIEIDGNARAYPINMLKGPHREIVNDNLAGESIAATW